jgi:hypothetical protein
LKQLNCLGCHDIDSMKNQFKELLQDNIVSNHKYPTSTTELDHYGSFSAMSAIAACKSLIAVMTVTRRPGTPARSKYGASGVVQWGPSAEGVLGGQMLLVSASVIALSG